MPLIVNLMKFQKFKSFIDKKHCLNDNCAIQFHFLIPSYFSESKLVLYKSDNQIKEQCNKCKNLRNCAVYQCKQCESKFCYYCLIDSSKRKLIHNLSINPPSVRKESEGFNGSNHGERKHQGMSTYELLHNEIVAKNFGKYRD